MGELWGKLWWRTFSAWVFASAFSAIAIPVGIAISIATFQPHGVLDFAGGSVIHVSPMPAFFVMPWLTVEAYNLRSKTPVPFGSYLAFIAAFTMAMLSLAQVPVTSILHWNWRDTAMVIAAYGLACSAGFAAGWVYLRLAQSRRRPKAAV